MSARTINQKGEILVTTTDVSELEDKALDTKELLSLVLQELRKVNLHLSVLSRTEFKDKDLGV